MAITPIEIPKLPEGLTLTCDVYPRGSDTADQTGITLTEETNRKGTYSGDVTAASTGLITVKVKLSGDIIAEVTGHILNTTAVFILEDDDRVFNQLFDPTTDTVANVTLVATTTTNSDMRGTDSANTVIPMLGTLSQTEHDATQTLIGALNDFDPSNDDVANVTLVATTTTNSDMRGTDSANTVIPMLGTLSQTEHDATQTNIAALNDFNPTTDTVANVTLVATTTTNSDMRGTDSAFLAASAPTNFSSLVISVAGSADALVQGFLNNTLVESTVDNIAANFETFYDNADAITAQTVDDVGGGGGGGGGGDATEAKQDTIILDIAALNDFDPANNEVAVVTLVGTTTTNSDMRGTDSANTVVPMTATLSQTEHDATQTNIAALNDFNPTTDTVALVTLVTTTTNNTDMRGTDSANTVVPMTAVLSQTEHNATQATLTGLNDISATDIVSAGAITTLSGAVTNVTLVGTTTTNTDMRGTDSANTVVPMTATLSQTEHDATQTNIAALNDFNPVTDTVALVTTTTNNTDMRGTDSAATAANLATMQTDVTQIKGDLPSAITKNTALANFPFLMVAASDDITPAVGLTVSATRSIDGGAFGAAANSVVEISNGMYKINLAASDLNGDTIILRFTAASANDRLISIVTQP